MLEAVGPLARPYRVGPILPSPPVPRCCSTKARMPASDGATNEVPPKLFGWPVEPRNPLVQEPWLQATYPSWSAAALSETSGVSREESLGTPRPTCHAGLEKKPLAPPPPAPAAWLIPVEGGVSFQGSSGMYLMAEPADPVPLFPYADGLLVSLNIVPPAEVTYGELPGKSTARPSVAIPVMSQSVAPESPAELITVMPLTFAIRRI